MIAWFEINYELRPTGFFGTFFDSNDSVIASDVPLDFPTNPPDQYFYKSGCEYLKSINLLDSIYLIFTVNQDSGYFYYRIFNSQGNPLSEVQLLILPNFVTNYNRLLNFSISNINQNKFNIILTNFGSNSFQNNITNYLLTFNTSGELEGDIIIDTTQKFNLGKNFVKISDSTFFIGIDFSNDAYLTKLNYFSPIVSTKLNDDVMGSNEIKPFVTKVDENHFFTSWQNEVKYAGQLLHKSGNKIRNPITLEGKKCEFYPDWSFINVWQKNPLFGFTIYNAEWNVVKRETIKICSNLGDIKILSDSTFVIIYSRTGQDVWLTKYDKNGIEILSKEVTSLDQTYGLSIFINDANSFWIRFGGKVQKFSNSLQPLSDATISYVSLHLEDNKFLRVFRDYSTQTMSFYGLIVSSTGDTLKNRFLLSTYSNELSYGKLTPKSFIVIYNIGNNIFAQAYTNDGLKERDSVLIHTPNQNSKQHCNFAVNNNKVLFAWSEARIPTYGYSIYGSVFDVSTFVSVKDPQEENIPLQFNLYQNYPNPFNPSTNILFDIPKTSFVTLKVSDILGREVTTLVDEEKLPGKYEINFDGSGLASGIYYYQLTATPYNINSNKFLLTRKLILLK